MIKKLFVVIFIVNLSACGAGNGNGLDNQGLPVKNTTDEPSSNQNEGVTLANLQQNIFGAICTNCHTGSNAPRGLRLDSEENSYAFLVQRAADEMPELMRVTPGNPDASYIIRKLEGASGIVGSRMPLGGPYLSQAQIISVRDWIANGAPRTGTGTSPTKISSTIFEKTGSQLNASLHFSRTLDVHSVTEQNINISYTPIDTHTIIPINDFNLLVLDDSLEINFQNRFSPAGNITISLKSADEMPILDSQQQAIDGDSDNNEGGEYRYEHTIK